MIAMRPFVLPPKSPASPLLADLVVLGALVGATVRRSRQNALVAAAGGQVHRRGVAPGRGLEYAGSRPYLPGDDARALDWRQLARRGRPMTKQFHPETEQPVLMFVDLGPRMQWGSRAEFKAVAAARAAATLAWGVAAAGDRVGGVVSDGKTLRLAPPRGHTPGVLQWLRALAPVAEVSEQGSLSGSHPLAGWEAIIRLQRPGGQVVAFVDHATLAASGAEEERCLRRISRVGQLLLVPVVDVLEQRPPSPGRYPIDEDGHVTVVDYADPAVRHAHADRFTARAAAIAAVAGRVGAGVTWWWAGRPPVDALRVMQIGLAVEGPPSSGGGGRP